MFFITVKNDAVQVELDDAVVGRFTKVEDFEEFVNNEGGEVSFYVSSSVHFPEEYTDDPEVIHICEMISE